MDQRVGRGTLPRWDLEKENEREGFESQTVHSWVPAKVNAEEPQTGNLGVDALTTMAFEGDSVAGFTCRLCRVMFRSWGMYNLHICTERMRAARIEQAARDAQAILNIYERARGHK